MGKMGVYYMLLLLVVQVLCNIGFLGRYKYLEVDENIVITFLY